ncbi:hypothetical protein [Sulfobacillus thermosulfidooxidans]|uniref:hypothetical protein n=1 Tax=Sulfobacillus thermosulfidooxidans TaxID=28034 RepID=UPI000382972D|nr:hypothetical protein [Sulfobacillus thermosulfidooxidans]
MDSQVPFNKNQKADAQGSSPRPPIVSVNSGQVWIGPLSAIDPIDHPAVYHHGVLCSLAPGRYTVQVTVVDDGGSRRIRQAAVVPDPEGPIILSDEPLVFIDPGSLPHWGRFGDGGPYDQCCQVILKSPHYGPAVQGFVVESGWGDGDYKVDLDKQQITFF